MLPLTKAMKAYSEESARKIHRTIRVQGSLLEFRTAHHHRTPLPTVPRGKITSFSRASRLRLLKFVATIKWRSGMKSLFMTLTYPDLRIPTAEGLLTIQRSRFLRDMEKHLGRRFAALWRVEWMERKSGKNKGIICPHIHLICFDIPFISFAVIRKAWKQILCWDDFVAMNVQVAGSGKMAALYIAKYMGKEFDQHLLDNHAYLNNQGRHWGFHRKSMIPQCEVSFVEKPTEQQVNRLMEFARTKGGWIDKVREESFTLFGADLIEIRQFLEQMDWTWTG